MNGRLASGRRRKCGGPSWPQSTDLDDVARLEDACSGWLKGLQAPVDVSYHPDLMGQLEFVLVDAARIVAPQRQQLLRRPQGQFDLAKSVVVLREPVHYPLPACDLRILDPDLEIASGHIEPRQFGT
jgi:hypothetical protein